jgi:hypothetical protein
MQKLWGAKTVNRAEIERVHKDAVSKIAKDITDRTIKTMYPNNKPSATAAQGRAAAKVAPKVEKAPPVGVRNQSLGKAELVAEKPKNLLRDTGWELLVIAGKGYVPTADGGKKLVQWRR